MQFLFLTNVERGAEEEECCAEDGYGRYLDLNKDTLKRFTIKLYPPFLIYISQFPLFIDLTNLY